MTPAEADAIRDHACTRKHRLGLDAASRVAADTPGLAKYRCPFCRSWHVGHVPSLDALQQIAAAIRVLSQEYVS